MSSFLPVLRPKVFPSLQAVLCRGAGAKLWDTEGNAYIDFFAGNAAVNQGHCHPAIVKALTEQAGQLTLTTMALVHDQQEAFVKKMSAMFSYECVIPMSTGTEAVETAIKFCRRWAYQKKGIPENEAKVVLAEGNYWGHSLAALSCSDDPVLNRQFGPLSPGFSLVPYGNIEALEAALDDPHVCALILETIQAESGNRVPPPGYLRAARELCWKKNVLLVVDEIQTGLARTGKLLDCHYEKVRPDLLILGKALSGGTIPLSAVLCDREVGDLVRRDEHGSTFALNPLACRVGVAALEVIEREKLAENAMKLGEAFRAEVMGWKIPWIQEVRGRGLLNVVEVAPDSKVIPRILCRLIEQEGMICVPASKSTIRFSPPLVISEEEHSQSLEKLKKLFRRCTPQS